ncbi:hypothetical protein [Streptomyces hydrogenans]|uniref:hypothetical protein n=2 Tax=Streptomyces hydrogenans TaxID=1873719 RepID=UPI003D73F9BA
MPGSLATATAGRSSPSTTSTRTRGLEESSEQYARVADDGRSHQAGNIICTTEATAAAPQGLASLPAAPERLAHALTQVGRPDETVTALRRAVAVFHDMDDEHHEALARQNPDAALRDLRAAPGKRLWWPFGTRRASRTER